MTHATPSADIEPLVSRNAAREAFRDALRLYVGRGRRFSVKEVSRGAGVAARWIEGAMSMPDSTEQRNLPLEIIASLGAFLGPEFNARWMQPQEQGAYWLPDADDTPPGVLAADVTEDAAQVVRRAADGELDREDRVELRPVGRRMMAVGARLAMDEAA